jgi:hypothetical protein
MVDSATLIQLEMRYLQGLTREQLVEGLRERADCLPADLRERLGEQPPDRLRLLLCAARLMHALRRLPRKEEARNGSR